MGANMYPIMKRIADKALTEQVQNPGDFFNSDGLLMCGKCKEPRQMVKDFPNPTDFEPDRMTPLLRVRPCACERKLEAEHEEQEKAKKEMEKIERLRAASLMDSKFSTARFETYVKNNYNEKNLRLLRRYATGFEEMYEKKQGLLLWGDTGRGKSWAAACIANYLLDQKVPVIMTSFVKIVKLIYDHVFTETELVRKLNEARLVIFDDLGAERETSYAQEIVYNVIDSRWRVEKPMIVTTNLTLDEMNNETNITYKRTYGRIFDTCYPMQFTGFDWRKKSAEERFEAMRAFMEG